MPLDKLWALHQSVASILALRLEIQSKRDPAVILSHCDLSLGREGQASEAI